MYSQFKFGEVVGLTPGLEVGAGLVELSVVGSGYKNEHVWA